MSCIMTERDVYTEILQLYRASPCLWNTEHVNYNNKAVKNKAFQALVEKMKIMDKEADISSVKKKLDNMRSAHKREWRRVQKSKLLGGAEHVPSLWYYELLTFLTVNDTYYNNEVYNEEEFCYTSPSKFDHSNLSPSEEVIQPRPVGNFVFINSEIDERNADKYEVSYVDETPRKKKFLDEKLGEQFDIVDINMKENMTVNSTTTSEANTTVQQQSDSIIDEDYNFFLSLLPQMRKFDELQRMKIKVDFMNIIAREVERTALKPNT